MITAARAEIARVIESHQGHLGGTDTAIIADAILSLGYRKPASPVVTPELAGIIRDLRVSLAAALGNDADIRRAWMRLGDLLPAEVGRAAYSDRSGLTDNGSISTMKTNAATSEIEAVAHALEELYRSTIKWSDAEEAYVEGPTVREAAAAAVAALDAFRAAEPRQGEASQPPVIEGVPAPATDEERDLHLWFDYDESNDEYTRQQAFFAGLKIGREGAQPKPLTRMDRHALLTEAYNEIGKTLMRLTAQQQREGT